MFLCCDITSICVGDFDVCSIGVTLSGVWKYDVYLNDINDINSIGAPTRI